MEAHTLNYRGTFKDYVDLYFILKEKHSSLEEIEKLAEKKYKEDFNFRLFLEQLIYLEDIQTKEINFLKEKTDKDKMGGFLKKRLKNIATNYLLDIISRVDSSINLKIIHLVFFGRISFIFSAHSIKTIF